MILVRPKSGSTRPGRRTELVRQPAVPGSAAAGAVCARSSAASSLVTLGDGRSVRPSAG